MAVSIVQLVDIPQRGDARGQLAVVELGGVLPFVVRRVYWIHGTKPGVSRGFHAHKKLRQLCVCVAGSVRLSLFDGRREESVVLDSSAKGLLIGAGLWREMHDFSPDCVLMVLADAEYDEADYLKDRDSFMESAADLGEDGIGFGAFDKLTLDKSYEWLNDPEIKALTDSPQIDSIAQARWFSTLASRSDYKAWSVMRHGNPIGVVGLKRISRESAEYFGYIGEKSLWGRGIGGRMLEFAQDQAKILGLPRMELRVVVSNLRAIRLYLRAGFTHVSEQGGSYLMQKTIGR